MDFSRLHLPFTGGKFRQPGDAERFGAVLFYGRYFRWPLLFVLLALAADKALFYGGMPLAAYAREQWAYAQAACDDAAGRDQDALAAVRRALVESRSDARSWRLAAGISDRLDSPEAAYCWQQADRLQPGSTETELALADAALAQGQSELAGTALRELAAAGQNGARYALDAGRLAEAEGQPERARYWFEQVEAARPGDARALFVLAAWHAGLTSPGDQARARELFLELARRPSERIAARRALLALDLRRHDFAAARTDGDALLATPGATFADRVAHLDIAASSGAAETDAELAGLLHAASPADAARALDWMTDHGRAEAALIWIRRQDESWQDDPAIGAARARCLAALGEWEHLRDDQRDSVWPGHESARWMWLARASLELGNENDARTAWFRAIAACAQPGDFTELEQAADSFRAPDGWNEEKAELWTALANRFPDQQWPLRTLLAYQLGRGDLVAAQELAERLVALAPGDATLGATFDLIRLRRGFGTGPVETDLRRLEQAGPENPAVATAAAFALYREGRFDDALATLGALDPAGLRAPERAATLGQLLAAAGPVDRARVALDLALAQPDLLDEQRAGIERALDLVAYRRAMANLLHGSDGAARDRARDFFAVQAASGKAVFLIGESVALASDPDRAAGMLARIDPAALNPAELSLDEGAALSLAGQTDAAAALLELAGGLPFETPDAKWHHVVEAWWKIADRGPLDAPRAAGLLAAYRGLEMEESAAAFWQRDMPREMKLTRAALALPKNALAAAVQERLEALARHVPATPEMEAEIGYALFLQGRIEAGRQRLEVLSPAELARPEPAQDYEAILRACGEKKHAEHFLQRPPLAMARFSEGENDQTAQ